MPLTVLLVKQLVPEKRPIVPDYEENLVYEIHVEISDRLLHQIGLVVTFRSIAGFQS